MAVERAPQFVLNLGNVIKARLQSLAEQRKIIQAREEAEFQRRVIEQGLSLEDQLSYRLQQLEREQKKRFPDQDFVSAIKLEISNLKKLVRQKKFRDKYYNFLQEASLGRKSVSDELNFLYDQLEGVVDEDIKDQIRERIIELNNLKLKIDRSVENQRIEFYEKDKTLDSYNKAIDLVKKQLSRTDVIKNPEILTAYQLKLQALEQGKAQIATEQKINELTIEMAKASDSLYPSLTKLKKLNLYLSTAREDMPVVINGVRYNSEKEFWQTTLDKFVNTEFIDDFKNEVSKNLKVIKTKQGKVSDDFISDISNRLTSLKNNPLLANYKDAILNLSQQVSSTVLSEKIDDIKSDFSLGTSLATRFDVWKAKNKLMSYQKYFPDISLEPVLKQFDEMAAEKQFEVQKEVFAAASDLIKENPELTWDQAIKKASASVGVTIPKEELMKPKTTEELGRELVEKAEKPEVVKAEEEKQKKEIIEEREKLSKKEQKLVKPEKQGLVKSEEQKQPEMITHRVKEGETLWSIAKTYLGSGTRWKELLKPEGTPFTSAEAKKLQVGQEIKIPKLK